VKSFPDIRPAKKNVNTGQGSVKAWSPKRGKMDSTEKIVDCLLRNEFCDEILGEDLRYCLEHRMSLKERQVCEHLVEGYKDEDIYNLLKKIFPTFGAYKICKTRVKKKLLEFLGM